MIQRSGDGALFRYDGAGAFAGAGTIPGVHVLPVSGTAGQLRQLLEPSTIFSWNGAFWVPSALPPDDEIPPLSEVTETYAHSGVLFALDTDDAIGRPDGVYQLRRGDVEVRATSDPLFTANAIGVSAGLLAVGISWAKASSTANVTAKVGADAQINARRLIVAATYTPDLITTATAASGGLIGVTATSTDAHATGNVKAFVDQGANLSIETDTTLNATTNTFQSAISTNLTFGLIAAGAAKAYASAMTKTLACLGDGVELDGGGLSIAAVGTDRNLAVTTAGSGGLIAGAATNPATANTANTHAALGTINDSGDATGTGNLRIDLSKRGTGIFALRADHTVRFDSQVITAAGGLLAGAGAESSDAVITTVKTRIGAGTDVTAQRVTATATNNLDKTGLGVDNIVGTTGGLVSGAAARSFVHADGHDPHGRRRRRGHHRARPGDRPGQAEALGRQPRRRRIRRSPSRRGARCRARRWTPSSR